jgi:hypothetical protein
MGRMRYRRDVRTFGDPEKSGDITTYHGPWGVYGEAIGNPKFYIGSNPKDPEFLQAADEFMAAHKELLRELSER